MFVLNNFCFLHGPLICSRVLYTSQKIFIKQAYQQLWRFYSTVKKVGGHWHFGLFQLILHLIYTVSQTSLCSSHALSQTCHNYFFFSYRSTSAFCAFLLRRSSSCSCVSHRTRQRVQSLFPFLFLSLSRSLSFSLSLSHSLSLFSRHTHSLSLSLFLFCSCALQLSTKLCCAHAHPLESGACLTFFGTVLRTLDDFGCELSRDSGRMQ